MNKILIRKIVHEQANLFAWTTFGISIFGLIVNYPILAFSSLIAMLSFLTIRHLTSEKKGDDSK